MFSHELSLQQRKALVSLLSRVARADGKVSDSEQSMVVAFSEALGVQSGEDGLESGPGELVLVFSSQRAARIALLELVTLAYVDDDYSLVERELVESIAGAMNVSIETVRRIEAIVELGRLWKKHCDGMLAA
jgi:uncharacterized tellurite resistance protein B-like protein